MWRMLWKYNEHMPYLETRTTPQQETLNPVIKKVLANTIPQVIVGKTESEPSTALVAFPIVPRPDSSAVNEQRTKNFNEEYAPVTTDITDKTKEELARVQRLQSALETALGISHAEAVSHDGVLRSYNPVLDRYRLERDVFLNDTLSPVEKLQAQQRWRSMIEWQMITNLQERFNVDANPYQLHIQGEKLFYSDGNTQPLEEIYWRGVEHRKKESSPESKEEEREEAEFEGFLKLQKIFTDSDTPIGTKRIIISPPGTAKKTPYSHNFVDILELKKDGASNKRYIQAMRYSTKLTNAQYWEKAHCLDPQYHYATAGGYAADDARFLSHPITPRYPYTAMDSDTLYDSVFFRDPNTMKYKDFQSVILTPQTIGIIHHYADKISQSEIDWKGSALAFNAVPNFGDYLVKEWKKKLKQKQEPFTQVVFDRFTDYQKTLALSPEALSHYWGKQEVKTVAGGCGNSAGYIMHESLYHGIQDPLSKLSENSVAQFGLESHQDEEENYEKGTCVECGATNVERGRCSKRCKNFCEPGWFRANGITASS